MSFWMPQTVWCVRCVLAGEEHWTKVLQANEVMGGAGGRGRPHPHPQTGVLAAMYVRFWRWVGAAGRRDLTVGPAAAVAAAGVTAGRSSSLPCGAPHHRCAPHHPACRRHASVSSPDDGPGADLSVSSRSLSAATERQHWWRDTLTRTCSTDSCRCGAPPSPCRQRDGRWQHASVASTISCPPVTRRTSPLASPLTTSPSPLATSLSLTGCEPTTTAASNKERMCSTWPPQGGATYRNGEPTCSCILYQYCLLGEWLTRNMNNLLWCFWKHPLILVSVSAGHWLFCFVNVDHNPSG